MSSILAFVLAATASAAEPPRSSTASGLVSTSEMTVRVVVADRCTVSPAGAVCQGAAPIRPLAVSRPSAPRIDIVF